MILKNSQFSIQDNNREDLENLSRKYPAPEDLRNEQNISSEKTVHYRRDLDSLG
tara:strand:- start:585 stop:746 length:162 start_codon:yes stop_codon:yes gene_type:complete